MRYMPWMTESYNYGTTPTTYKFTGQRQESTLGLYFYNARWYDPSLARFISADTIVPGAGNPQAYDRYAYVFNNPLRYTDPSGYHYCDSKYAAEEVCDWYNKAPLPDKVCIADRACYEAYLTYNAMIFLLGRIPTIEEIIYMTAQTEGYGNKEAEYHGSGTFEDNFIEGLARNFYQPYNACNIGSWTCTENRLYKFMSGYQVWFGSDLTPTGRAYHLINDGLKNDAYRNDLNYDIGQILNRSIAEMAGWTNGYVGDKPWQWHNWIRPPDLKKGEAIGWIYSPSFYGDYFWIMTADQTWYFQHEIEPNSTQN